MLNEVEQARLELEKASIILNGTTTNPSDILKQAKEMFSKGYNDIELIAKVGNNQIAYLDLIDAGSALNYEELPEELKQILLNENYIINDGIVSDSATVQATTPEAQQAMKQFDLWKRDDSDYYTLPNESKYPAILQIELILKASIAIAESTDELSKLEYILRPTKLHENLLKALMKARGMGLELIPSDNNNGQR